MSVRMTGAAEVGRTAHAVFLLHTARLAGVFFILLSNHIFEIIIKSVDISL